MDGYQGVNGIGTRFSDFIVDNRYQFLGSFVLAVIFIAVAQVLGLSALGLMFLWMCLVIIQFTFLILWEVEDIIDGQEW
jgi:hypothetical protein